MENIETISPIVYAHVNDDLIRSICLIASLGRV